VDGGEAVQEEEAGRIEPAEPFEEGHLVVEPADAVKDVGEGRDDAHLAGPAVGEGLQASGGLAVPVGLHQQLGQGQGDVHRVGQAGAGRLEGAPQQALEAERGEDGAGDGHGGGEGLGVEARPCRGRALLAQELVGLVVLGLLGTVAGLGEAQQPVSGEAAPRLAEGLEVDRLPGQGQQELAPLRHPQLIGPGQEGLAGLGRGPPGALAQDALGQEPGEGRGIVEGGEGREGAGLKGFVRSPAAAPGNPVEGLAPCRGEAVGDGLPGRVGQPDAEGDCGAAGREGEGEGHAVG
jgi:hypothetical protein